jgi:hypothetical protein
MYECRRSAITNVVTTKCALWRYDNAFLFTNQSEVDFGIAYVVGATYDRSFAWGAEHLGGHQLHNKEAEIAVCEWMRIEEPISVATELSPWHKVMHHADKQRYCGAMITALNVGMTSGVI